MPPVQRGLRAMKQSHVIFADYRRDEGPPFPPVAGGVDPQAVEVAPLDK